ncbi:uncharacterized protein PAC_00531 [Phialocephala subalpina]|uniref:SAM and PH domain protein n=1 Tax=Phialocephala subalpina TaxID=576137 RepID=A0A1L7WD18_9HELO|nr:uncharacterized protein PAC_00531 [Phialocephala subalpina]
MPNYSPQTPIDPRVEMFQKGQPIDAFFNMKALAPRPVSDATEMFDTDFEDSDVEESNSPRLSVNSSGRQSERTLSSFEEVHTPSPTQNEFEGFNFDISMKPAVEGPRGPHLFRSSVDSSIEIDDDEYTELAMSPMTPRPSSIQRAAMAMSTTRIPDVPSRQHRHLSTLTDAVEHENPNEIALWTPRQVARWMYNAGFEPSIVEKFEENDISGAILITLKFEDLRELDIQSFGQRTKVWNEIHVLRDSKPSTPAPPTPIEEVASPCVDRLPRHSSRRRDGSRRREGSTKREGSRRRGGSRRRDGSRKRSESADCGSDEQPRRHKSKRRHRKRSHEDIISPLESVSIVGIEQIMPKPHKCAKGENCSKWRKQQRLIESFKKDHPLTPDGGSIWIAGDPGNPLTAEAIDMNRPVSEAVPSVVASSDVLGPGPVPAFRHLEEASLRNVQSRDPQENVKQFIKFQHMDPQQVMWTSEEPPTPPYEMFPALQTPHVGHAPAQAPVAGLRGLPRLAIPPPRPAPPQQRSASAQAFSPYRMERVEAMSPDLRNATQSPSTAVYRFGTPFSEMDIPVTAVPLGPVARDASQSVPPNMSYRHAPAPALVAPPQRTQSRASARRPSFAMPRVDENVSTAPPTQTRFRPEQTQPPPTHYRQNSNPNSYPWSPVQEPTQRTADDIAHAGWMKKRKTRMLRHEWHEHHFTLKGTRLSMHKDARALETLEYIDVDDYAIACSSLASGSKLNAAFKAMNISLGDKSKKDEAAFAFQLIPAAIDKGQKLRKREFADDKDAAAKAKTHYFAVKSRDERIDWMRELMLAKALKQKSEGYEVNVNGNMI